MITILGTFVQLLYMLKFTWLHIKCNFHWHGTMDMVLHGTACGKQTNLYLNMERFEKLNNMYKFLNSLFYFWTVAVVT